MINFVPWRTKRPAGSLGRTKPSTVAPVRRVFLSAGRDLATPAPTLRRLSVHDVQNLTARGEVFHCSFLPASFVEGEAARRIGVEVRLVFEPPPKRGDYYVLQVSLIKGSCRQQRLQSLMRMQFFEVMAVNGWARTNLRKEVVLH